MTLINIEVQEVGRYRDGGTIVYQDKLGRQYFQWHATKKVYNQWPFPNGSAGLNNIPPQFVTELPVDLIVVEQFFELENTLESKELIQAAITLILTHAEGDFVSKTDALDIGVKLHNLMIQNFNTEDSDLAKIKNKAAAYDKLYDEIAGFYGDDPVDDTRDLGDIGEVAATHFGFL